MRLSRFAIRALALGAAGSFLFDYSNEPSRGLLLAAAEDAPAEAPTTDAEGEAAAHVPPTNAETFSFESDVSRVLDLVINSLYQHNEIFLRELISNSNDALDKIRYLMLTEPDTYKIEGGENIDLEIKIEYDADAQTLTIRDTGVGMSREDMVKNLGTIARSGTTKFVEALKESGNQDQAMSQIGQFGVGFYSSFLVADRVTVTSKSPTDPVQHVWASENGSHDFMVYPDPRGSTMERGTEITLHLKEDSLEYIDPQRLKELAKHYSEFMTYPISLRTTETTEVEIDDDEDEEKKEDDEDGEKKDDDELEVEDDEDAEDKPKKTKEVTTYSWEVLNDNQAIWTRDKDEISDEDYESFWQVLSGDDTKPSSWTHFDAEGKINFRSILYLPPDVPPSYRMGQMEHIKGSLKLYVRKVLISDDFELMPKYLGFIRGVVDSDDLPLNVNRETLQEHKILQVIKKKLVRKAIDLIRQFEKESTEKKEKKAKKDEDEEDAEVEIDADGNVIEVEKKDEDEDADQDEPGMDYDEWYSKFAPNLKLGAIEDEPNRAKLMKLLRFETTKSDGKKISLAQYIENMKDWQDDIYVLGGTSVDDLKKSPFLEPFKQKDVEVVYMVDTIDEYVVQSVRSFDGKKFVQASSENVKFKDEDEDMIKRREKAYTAKFKPLTKWLRKLYKGSVMRVQVAKRNLGAVPAIVTSSEFGNTANMERILRAQAFHAGMDQMQMQSMKVFEINPRHPLIVKLLEGCPPDEDKKKDDDEDGEKEAFVVSDEVKDAAMMIHDMAMLNGGYPIVDPKSHNTRMTKVLQGMFGLDSLALEDEIEPPEEEDEPPEGDDGPDFGAGPGSHFVDLDEHLVRDDPPEDLDLNDEDM